MIVRIPPNTETNRLRCNGTSDSHPQYPTGKSLFGIDSPEVIQRMQRGPRHAKQRAVISRVLTVDETAAHHWPGQPLPIHRQLARKQE